MTAEEIFYKHNLQPHFEEEYPNLHETIIKAMKEYALACLAKAADNAKLEYHHTEYLNDIYVVDKESINSKENLV